MIRSQIERCRARIAEEERCALLAPTPEAQHAHDQMVMLYRAKLAMLLRESGDGVAAAG